MYYKFCHSADSITMYYILYNWLDITSYVVGRTHISATNNANRAENSDKDIPDGWLHLRFDDLKEQFYIFSGWGGVPILSVLVL